MIPVMSYSRQSRIEVVVTEEAEKASLAEDTIGAQMRASGHNSFGQSHVKGASLNHEEREAIDFLTRLDFEYIASDNTNLTFRRVQDDRLRLPLSPRSFFPRSYVSMLLGQLGDKVEGHPGVTGFIIPSRSYVELICSRIQPAMAKRIFRLKIDDIYCQHKASANELASLPYHWPDEDGEQSAKRVHLSGRDGHPCLEISNASPLAGLLYGQIAESSRLRLASPEIPLLVTLKMTYSLASDAPALAQNSEEAARSLIYELNVRNDVILELVALPAR